MSKVSNDDSVSNICLLEDILNAESEARQLVAIIAIRIDEGPTVFRKVMQENLNRGIEYRYLLLRSGEVSLENSFRSFQNTLNRKNANSFRPCK